MKIVITALIIPLLFAACGGGNIEPVETANASLPELTLFISDSIGIELGDSSYVFGAIADAEILPDGNIIVLDRTCCNMRIFSPEGVFIRTISRRGSGPGELMNPFFLYSWGNGEVSVIDPYAGGIHRFNADGEWLGLDLQLTHNSFFDPVVVSDSSFVAFKSRFDQDGDAVIATALVALFPMTVEPEAIYWQKSIPWDPVNMGNLALEAIFSNFYTADPATGTVYVSPFHGDGYSIQCYLADGTPAGEITAEYTPVPKSDEEIQAEKDFIEFYLRAGENNNPDLNYDCDPWPNHFAVTGLYIGSDGDLWALRGGTDVVTFDIWNSDHELAGTVSLPEFAAGNSSWKFAFGPDLVIAWNENPQDYQKIYILKTR
jgi:hypothetical protein